MKKNTSKTSKTINKIEEKDQVIEDVEIIEDSPIDTPTPWEPQPKTSPSSPKQNSYLVALGILLIALVSLIYYFKSSFIAAIVNGQPIWRTTLNKQLTKQFGEQLLESLITQTLIEQQAKTKGIIISGEKIASETAKIEEQVIAQGQTLDQILLLQGMTREELEQQLKLNLLVRELSDEPASPSAEEINSYIKDNSQMLPKDLTGDKLNKYVLDLLQNQKQDEALQTWLGNLKQGAKIQMF